MGRRALTAQEKAERQRQRQEALHAKQTLRLVREHALDPHLRVIVDRALPISSASQTIAATIGSFGSSSSINPYLLPSGLTMRLI